MAAVVTGERPNLKTNRLGSRRLVYGLILQKRERCCKSGKVGLESKPRGRQAMQNWLSTPANSTVGTVITTDECKKNRRRSQGEGVPLFLASLKEARKSDKRG